MPFVIDDIVGLVGLAVAVPGLVQVFVHSARWLSKRLQEAPISIDKKELEDLLLSLDCGTIRTTLETVEDICLDTNDHSIRKSLQENAEKLWPYMLTLQEQILNMKAKAGDDKEVQSARKKAVKAAKALSEWEGRLQAQVERYVMSQSIRSRFELRDTKFTLIGNTQALQQSAVSVGRCDLNIKDRVGEYQCFLERKSYAVASAQDAYARAVELARSMQFFDASYGLPELIGFQPLSSSALGDQSFRFVFIFPDNRVNPRPLRNILLDPINTPFPPIPRNFRFILPRILAEAVYQIHEQKFVHKCIRPESILLFEPAPGDPKTQYPNAIGAPILTDWEYTRKLDHVSRRARIDDWTLAMYQHPQRQAPPGEDLDVRYHIGHDIYSLGVCLLEIGLWDSFIVYKDNRPNLSALLLDEKAKWKQEHDDIAPQMEDAQIEQKVYLVLAETRLSYEMGEAYSRLVIKCLSCIEHGFGNTKKFVDYTKSEWEEQGTLFAQEIRRCLHDASTMGSGIYNTLR